MRQGFLRALFRKRIARVALFLLGVAVLTIPFTRKRGEPAPPPVPVEYVVATTTIPPRTLIASNMVAIKSVTGTQAQNVPASALRKVDEAVNSVTKELIPTGETVKREHLLGQLGSLGVGSLIPPGKRAMMLTLRHQPRVVQLLHPGDRVDVIATFDNEFSRAVLEDIEVMSISEIVKNSAQPQNNANNPPPPPEPLLTVAVTPKEAEALALVADATLNVVLHPKGSVEMPQYSEGTLKKEIMRKLVRDRAPKSPRVYQPPLPRVVIQQPPSLPIRIEPAPSVKAPPTNTVEVIAGGQRKVVEIPAKPQ